MDATPPGRRGALLRLAAVSLAPLLPSSALGDAASLNRMPRLALVMGNSRYRDVPALRNPANDAAAFARRLSETGFSAIPAVDVGKAEMEKAVADYCARLSRDRGVGLFYFAGHGVQLGWRNYLLPVDARIGKAEDVGSTTLDLGVVLEGLRNAKNAMNIVILDACRDNPFAADFRTGKGLSQVDAPAGTLLAYATSPGNTASDGEGDNGLYTENILREMAAHGAKIEDIFKRVRLDVRRATRGAQVPWESTSLEEDFYFFPPANLSSSAHEADDAAEDALWQKVGTQADKALEGPR